MPAAGEFTLAARSELSQSMPAAGEFTLAARSESVDTDGAGQNLAEFPSPRSLGNGTSNTVI